MTTHSSPALRYLEAHKLWFQREFPQTFKDGHYTPPKKLDTTKANGLTTFAINYITWLGYRATRINTMGRLITEPQKQASGISLMTKKYMKSATRRGTADISATIRGRSVMIEIKTGSDRPSDAQLAEQAKERRAGGVYEFARTPEDIIDLVDRVLYG